MRDVAMYKVTWKDRYMLQCKEGETERNVQFQGGVSRFS